MRKGRRLRRATGIAVFAVLVATVVSTASATHVFDDVDDGRFFSEPVEWAADNGITTGRTPTIFDPNAPVTRGEAVTFLKRYHDNIAADLDTDTDTDTLADLTCGPDQVAVRSGGWRCADPVLERTFTGFSAPAVLDLTAGGHLPDAVVTNDGTILIGHISSIANEVRLYVCDDPTCGSGSDRLLAAAPLSGRSVAVAVTTDNRPIVAFRASNGDLAVHVCDDAACNSGVNRSLLTGGPSDLGRQISITIGTDGNPRIVHRNATAETLMFHACFDPLCEAGGGRTLHSGLDVGNNPDIVIGADDNPLVSHYNATNGDLELFACGNPACSFGTNRVLTSVGDVGDQSGIILGVDGNPLISHRDRTAVGLSLYVCADIRCETGTNRFLETGDAGAWTRIALDAQGLPVVRHYGSSLDPEVYFCANASCTSGKNRTMRVVNSFIGDIVLGSTGDLILVTASGVSQELWISRAQYEVTGVAFD